MTSPVPHLNLAPKLRRPLSLWNPLDYLRLLYWVFFFPQALQWYTNWHTQKLPEEFFIHTTLSWKDLGKLLPNNTLRKLCLQTIILTIILSGIQIFILNILGMEIGYLYVLNGVGLGSAIFLFFLMFLFLIMVDLNKLFIIFWENWINWVLPLFITLIVIFNLFLSLSEFPSKDQVYNIFTILFIAILKIIWMSISINAIFAILLNILEFELYLIFGLFILIFIIITNCIVTFDYIQAKLGILTAIIFCLLLFILSVIVSALVILRPDDWLLNLFLRNNLFQNNANLKLTHVTLIPLPYVSEKLQEWLRYNWETGVINAKITSYFTIQFVSVINAINQVLSETPPEQVVYRIAQLAEPPYNWQLIRCLCGYLFPLSYSLNTPVAATSAGFWFLHNKDIYQSIQAFSTVRSLNYGSEMFILTQTLFDFNRARDLNNIAALKLPNFPKEPLLRPETWKVIASLRGIAEDIKVIKNSSSRSYRAFALSRAIGELKNLRDKRDIFPELERELIYKIVINWSVALMDVATEVGQIRINHRVINPYIVGDPVQGKLFIGREDVLRQLEELWIMGNQLQSVVLYGHRRMGKTSILLNASQCLGSGIQLAYVNLLRLGDTPQGVGEVLIAISDEISQTVKLPPPNDADLLNLPYRTFERYLKQVETQLETGLIIALDEFEKIEELIEAEKIPSDFMGYLRGLVQMSSKVAFAFAGLHTLEEMTADYFQPFFASVIPIHINFQERAATRQILANPDEDFLLDYTPEALDEIYALTSGQPYLVQLVGFQLVRRYNDQVFEQGRPRDPVFTIEDVEAVINDPEFFQRGRYYFDGVWGQAAQGANGQQEILKLLAPHIEGLSFDALAESTGMNSHNLQAALDTLKRHDVVAETEGRWQIIVELFRRSVVQWRIGNSNP